MTSNEGPEGSHYEVLGIDESFPTEAIRGLRAGWAKRHHPDSGSHPDAGRMRRINDACDVLGDPGLRAGYDRSLAAARAARPSARPDVGAASAPRPAAAHAPAEHEGPAWSGDGAPVGGLATDVGEVRDATPRPGRRARPSTRLLVVVAIAAVVALLVGIKVGRDLLSGSTPPAPRADVVHFKDDVAKYSIDYPATWTRLPQPAGDAGVALLAAENQSTSLLVRVSDVGLTTVTRKTLPVVRKLTDDLIGADPRTKQLVPPVAVVLGGLPGWRYRYTYQSDTTVGAHDHYFLFKAGRMIQLVFQAQPAAGLPAVAGTFDRIAATFKGKVT